MQQKKKNDDNTRFIRVSGEICLFFDFDFVSFEKFSKKKQCHFHQSCDICFESTFFFSLITKKERIFLFCFRTMNSEKQQRKSCFLVKNRSKKNQLELIDNQNDWKNFLVK